MLIDDVTITAVAGNGGPGRVAYINKGTKRGPLGGNGGKGGHIWAEGVNDVMALDQFRYKKVIEAGHGEMGGNNHSEGASGQDLIIRLPIGTIIHNSTLGVNTEVMAAGQRLLLARGGLGGKGNFYFRSSRNTTPHFAQPGLPGQRFILRFELKLIAQVGLIGLPNAGKSSLLNELTNAQSKVANYEFTTLEPNLGAYGKLILADIPGLIEGASKGKGLGVKFLRHIERTKVLFHLISAQSKKPVADYRTIRRELGAYNKALLKKPEYVFVSKSDLVSPEQLKSAVTKLKKINSKTYTLSIHDPAAITRVEKILVKLQK